MLHEENFDHWGSWLAVHGVRIGTRIELARVLWTGRELLVMPGAGESDFVVLPAGDLSVVRTLLAGRIAQVLDPALAR